MESGKRKVSELLSERQKHAREQVYQTLNNKFDKPGARTARPHERASVQTVISCNSSL